jgi:uncharacterized protein
VNETSNDAQNRLHAIALAMALGAVAAYRTFISPFLWTIAGPACRFDPTCSQYARRALVEHGVIRGLWLTARRLMRCRPLGGWGYDPVPSRQSIGQYRI